MHSPYGMELVDSCRGCKLRSADFFCAATPDTLKDFEAIKLTTAYPSKAVLFVEGQEPPGVFMLCKGRVKLSITSREGKSLVLRIAWPGEVLGLDAALSGKPYEGGAETLEPCQVNFVGRQDFLRFLSRRADASLHAAEQLSRSYREACDQLHLLALSNSAHEKLARFLLEWSANGQRTAEGISVRLGLTHEEIGQNIGASRETVTRTLGEFRSKRLLNFKGPTLMIRNRAALESFSRA